MNEREYIKLEVRGQLPTILFTDQISSVVSLGILGTKIVMKEVEEGKNVEYIFPVNFDSVEDKLQQTGRRIAFRG